MRDTSDNRGHMVLKRTRHTSRSNSGCSSEDEIAPTPANGVGLHKRPRYEVHHQGSNHGSNAVPSCSSSLANVDPLTATLKLKDPTRIYNFGYRKKPAELFRKDLISAMKMADSEQLNDSDYILITDHWKEEWEKGVQVPVNPDVLPSASFRILKNPSLSHQYKSSESQSQNNSGKFSNSPQRSQNINSITQMKSFKLPKEYIKSSNKPSDGFKYQLDLIDVCWQKLMQKTCLPSVPETLIEDVITELERQCAENMKNNKIGIEFNDGVVCDVCRSPYSEDGNEMIFCDTCNVCVHQACYDIDEIPSGEWYCQPCRELGRVDKASCVLCPNKNGAMKRTPDERWAHVSCSLWVVSQIDGDHKDNLPQSSAKKQTTTTKGRRPT